ncbi:MAG: polysaccharide biosynthesis/export family protein [Hyphomicrobiaceae bacterium]
MNRTKWRILFHALFVLALTSGLSVAQASEPPSAGSDGQSDYRLDSQDKVRLKIFEWRAAIDQVYEWKALNAEYVIGADGRISVPLLGEIEARGRTTAELGQQVGDRMKERIGLVVVPRVSVEVVTYRPFYVTGTVHKPGEFPFRPGLNVVQAVAIAGGIGRVLDRERNLARELINAQGEVDVLSVERRSLLARRARLEAEIHGQPSINYPAEIENKDPASRTVMDRENRLFQLEQSGFDERVKVLTQRLEHLHAQVKTLKAQIDNHAAQTEIVKAELTKVEKLLENKLTVQPRRLEAQRNLYEMTRVGLTLESELRSVYQNISVTESEIERVRWEKRSQAMKDLRTTDLRLAELERRIVTSHRLYLESVQYGSSSIGSRLSEMIVDYTILRVGPNGMQHIRASETTLVRPGDTIRVKIETTGQEAAAAGAFPSVGFMAHRHSSHLTPPPSRSSARIEQQDATERVRPRQDARAIRSTTR